MGEADQLVAKESAEDPTGRTFALGADSDYHVFRGCRYIHFDQLKVCMRVYDLGFSLLVVCGNFGATGGRA